MSTRAVQIRRARRFVLLAASFALSWAAAVALTGGLAVRTPWGLVSSRGADRPLLLGIVALVAYVVWCRRYLAADLAPLARVPWSTTVMVISTAAAFVCGVQWSSFLAGGPDASGYISQAGLWLRGTPWFPVPEWAASADWPNAAASAAPVGYRPGAHDRLVPTYPPGLPLLMAAVQRLGGERAVFLVVPVFGAAAVWAATRIANRLAGAGAGAAAGALLASSPAFLIMVVQPMSDVPAAACWALAIVAALRGSGGGAIAAGLATAVAILIRPNLAPLAAIVALMLAATPPAVRARVVFPIVYAAAVAPALVVLGAINSEWYGSPFESGYGSIGNLYAASDVLPNLWLYGAALFETQTPIMLLAFALPLLIRDHGSRRRVAILTGIVFPLAVLALYLPYERVKVWWFLRFLLPAYPPMLAAAAAALILIASRTHRSWRTRWIVPALLGGAIVYGIASAVKGGAFTIKHTDQRYAAAAAYARRLPARSVLLSEVHNGGLHHATGRDVLRWKIIAPRDIDVALSDLRRRGYSTYLIVDESELDEFRERFAGRRIVEEVRPELAVHIGKFVRAYALAGSPLP